MDYEECPAVPVWKGDGRRHHWVESSKGEWTPRPPMRRDDNTEDGRKGGDRQDQQWAGVDLPSWPPSHWALTEL